MRQSTHNYFPALTGMRAVAAFMVFFHHLPLHAGADLFIGMQLSFYSGVTIFFVLSGFLIAYRYGADGYSRRYFINRFARIVPLYWLLLTMVVLLQKNSDPLFLLQNYTLTHNLSFLFPSYGLAIGPSWSLTVEECFYVVAPLIFLAQRKYGLWLPLLAVLSLLFFFIVQKGFPAAPFPYTLLMTSFFGYGLAFFAGIQLASIVRNRKEKTGAKPVWTIIGMTAFALLSVPLVWATNKSDAVKQPLMVIFNNGLLPFAIAILFYGLLTERSAINNFLSTRAMQLLGKSSYAFYLLHLPLIGLLATPHLRPRFTSHNAYVAVVFLICIVLGIALYLFFEAPVNRWLRKSLAGGRKESPESPLRRKHHRKKESMEEVE